MLLEINSRSTSTDCPALFSLIGNISLCLFVCLFIGCKLIKVIKASGSAFPRKIYVLSQMPNDEKSRTWKREQIFFFLNNNKIKNKKNYRHMQKDYPSETCGGFTVTYRGSSSGSQPSSSLKQKKHWATSGLFSVGLWMKPALAIWKVYLHTGN